ncbi:MAG: AmmeMemoRadiSam system protein B [Salinivirgaceae bacterium]
MDKLINREPAVNGRFYPANPIELKSVLKEYFNKYRYNSSNGAIQALIVPHAGYVFSGEVAASAYALIDSTKKFDNVFILAPSHGYSIPGASIYNIGHYETPLSEVPVNLELANKLIAENSVFKSMPETHKQEHSIEVQLPFLQFHLKNKFQIIPILIGTDKEEYLKQIAISLRPYFNEHNLFVISSDFSHFPNYKDAIRADYLMKDAIITNKIPNVYEALVQNKEAKMPNLATSACGISAIITLLHLTENNPDIRIEAIKYMNSGDSDWGDHQRVVGYWSFAAINKPKESATFQLTEKDKSDLLQLARKTIDAHLNHQRSFAPPIDLYSKNLLTPTGVFVTLHNQKQLRGCLGRFDADEPLYKMVQKMAVASATQDNRFESVKANELSQLSIEISVLTPMKRIQSKDEIILGEHGIYIKQGMHHGTLLPQVATDNSWTVDEFLGYCSRNKAGLGWDGWKTAELYVYNALVFSEK